MNARKALATAAALVVMIGVGGGVTATAAANTDDNSLVPLIPAGIEAIPACEFEDGSTQSVCHWDAESRGNGEGRSFVSFEHGDLVVYLAK